MQQRSAHEHSAHRNAKTKVLGAACTCDIRYRSYGFLQSRVKRRKRKRDLFYGFFFGNELVE